MPEPAISIVIPTLGRERVLRETVGALLAPAERADEVLVIDQTPEHETETAAFLAAEQAAGRIRWLPHRPAGVVGAMNRGLREARGDIVLFLDDDIIPAPGLVAAHRRVYEEFPEAWAAVGRVVQPEDVESPSKTPASESRDHRPTEEGSRRRASGAARRVSPLRRDLEFRFNGTAPAWVANVMAGNLSVRRERALAIGGFDPKFIPPVSFRFETEFARRLIAAGGRIRFEPAAEIRHLRAPSGGTRSLGSHLTSASPLHGVGDYYYALRCGRGRDRALYLLCRPFREVCTRFHLRHPWWIPVKLIGEVRALRQALRLYRRPRDAERSDGSGPNDAELAAGGTERRCRNPIGDPRS